jgi:subtilase family serine protease
VLQVQAATNYLSSQGFSNINVEANQLLIEADGNAGQVEAAFNTTLGLYSINDVITGSNGLFTALPGYDYVTGRTRILGHLCRQQEHSFHVPEIVGVSR